MGHSFVHYSFLTSAPDDAWWRWFWCQGLDDVCGWRWWLWARNSLRCLSTAATQTPRWWRPGCSPLKTHSQCCDVIIDVTGNSETWAHMDDQQIKLKADSSWSRSAKRSVIRALFPHARLVSSLRNSCSVLLYVHRDRTDKYFPIYK